jgi:hypothetical protein
VDDPNDLLRRAAVAKQSLLLALKHANEAALDGSRTTADLEALRSAVARAHEARDQLQALAKRVQFHDELEHLASANPEESGRLITLVRLGVDAGYEVTEVRRLVDQALGRA